MSLYIKKCPTIIASFLFQLHRPTYYNLSKHVSKSLLRFFFYIFDNNSIFLFQPHNIIKGKDKSVLIFFKKKSKLNHNHLVFISYFDWYF